ALASVAILLKAGVVVAPLMIEHHDVGASANLFQIPERSRLRGDRSAVHARPDAVGPAGRPRCPVVQLPDLRTPRVAPHDPIAIRLVVPIRLPRKRLSSLRCELAGTVVAVADAFASESCPAI